MNFFSGDVISGMVNVMNSFSGNNNGQANQKQILLKNNLEKCTYPDEVKYVIEKSVRQLFHVYSFFNPDLLMFVENGVQRRFIQVKGILEIQIKAKICKVDFNMMLPADFPRASPFIRIVNRNPDYKIDPFYKALQSKTDPSSFVLNQKLNSVKTWHPSNSLVNVVIQCYELLKNRFPFSKPVQQMNSYGNSNNAWDNLYKKQDNFGGGGFTNNNPNNGWNTQNNNSWGNNPNINNPPPVNNWGNQPQQNAGWVNNWGNNNNNKGWAPNNPTTNNNAWGTNNNAWGAMGGMGGIVPGGNNANTNNIVAAQKLVGKQKQLLMQLNGQQTKLISKSQQLDVYTKSLQSESSYLRRQNFQMANFLKQNQQSSQILSLASIVQPKDELSRQILELTCSIKSRQQCSTFLEGKFNQQKISLQQFLKQLRKIQQPKFQQKFVLQKCINNRS